MFTFGDQPVPDVKGNLGFAGFRIHGPINRPDYFDEIGVFLGASYFRAVAKGQIYGLSARGLALEHRRSEGRGVSRSSAPSGSSGPPRARTRSSCMRCSTATSAAAPTASPSGPGETTIYDVEATLFPRVQIEQLGLAPLTSMYLLRRQRPRRRRRLPPRRARLRRARDQNGRGERIWRPLNNPPDLQISAFVDNNPRGFGLMQRERDFRDLRGSRGALRARPERSGSSRSATGARARSSWSRFRPTTEIHDNIVAYWRPARRRLRAKGEYAFTYRLHWGRRSPKPLGRSRKSVATRIGAGRDETRAVVIDFAGENLKACRRPTSRRRSRPTRARSRNIVSQPNPGDRRHAASASSSTPGGENVGRTARAAVARRRRRCRKSGCTDGRR